jgi:hypothetical protein
MKMDEEKDKAEEPEIEYIKKTITFYSSFEEENEATAKMNAEISPLEHLQMVTGIIQHHYADKLKNLMNPYKKINFIKCEYLN